MTTEHSDHALEAALQRVAKSDQRSTRNTIIATLIPIVLGLVFLAITYSQVSDLLAQKEKLGADVALLETTDRDLRVQITQKQEELVKLEKKVDVLTPLAGEGLGRKPEKIANQGAAIQEAALAVREAEQVGDGTDQTARRSKLTIAQYEKELERQVNLPVVVRTLEKYGFRVKNKTSKLQGHKTNALWFGEDVTSDDARLVALTLMGAGVELKWISRFKDWDGDYATRIHIGSFPKVTEFEPLTTQAVIETRDLVMFGNPAHPDFRPE